jgi:hypothetical protein
MRRCAAPCSSVNVRPLAATARLIPPVASLLACQLDQGGFLGNMRPRGQPRFGDRIIGIGRIGALGFDRDDRCARRRVLRCLGPGTGSGNTRFDNAPLTQPGNHLVHVATILDAGRDQPARGGNPFILAPDHGTSLELLS